MLDSSPQSTTIDLEIGIGACEEVREVQVAERDEAVYVQVPTTISSGTCTLQLLLFPHEITLDAPLGARPVIDGVPPSGG